MTNTPIPNQVFPSQVLASFAAQLEWSDIPDLVIRKTEDLLVDWFGSAVAGKNAKAVEIIAQFAQIMGPSSGQSEILLNRKLTSPYFAAMCNAAASHVVEQDDLHNSSVFHPATVIFSPALAVAQSLGVSGREFLVAVIAGYEVGIRIGEFMGRSHYKIFHTTGTVGSLAAAAAVGRLLKLSPEQMLHAFGSAGTQAAGLWEFLKDAADSKQLHTAHAAGTGLMSAYLAKEGFTGAQQILEGKQGMAAGMSTDADLSKLNAGLHQRWATLETSFKFHASCRHTHPAADALLQVMQTNHLQFTDLAHITTHVHQGAIDVLGAVTDPKTVHQSKFSMGTVLAIVAKYGHAGLDEFENHFLDPEICQLRDNVSMQLDPQVDQAYPQRWIGKVSVKTHAGREFHGQLDEPKGDPGNTLTRSEIESKAIRLALFSKGAGESEMRSIIAQLWQIAHAPQVGYLFK
jgi:2-methylcitrate dehydratase PrpD